MNRPLFYIVVPCRLRCRLCQLFGFVLLSYFRPQKIIDRAVDVLDDVDGSSVAGAARQYYY